MKSIHLKAVAIAMLAVGTFSSCINDDTYNKPEVQCVTLTPTKTVQEVRDMATATPTVYTGDDIIEAYVTSSDAGGTFYKSVSMVSTDGTIGFSVPVDLYNIYTEFEPGRKVYVNLKNRYFAIANGSLVIGDLFEETAVGRLVPEEFRRTVKASCEAVNEDEIVQSMTIAEALNNNNLNKLIDLENVQFVDGVIGSKYYDPLNDLGGATNLNLTDITGSTIIFRTSSFAKFAGKPVPSLNGTVRGVLTKFGSDFQFLARVESDIMLTQPRLDANPPVVGNAIQYLGAFTENFESYTAGSATTGQFNFPKYINDPVVGTRFWRVRSASGNKYIEMSSFGGTPEVNRSLFIVPVDMTAANTFAFKSKASFVNGNTLKVYYTMNYTPGADITTATLIDITSSFTISTGAAAFVPSGAFNIPASLTGNGYFIFEYKGSGITPLITSNMDIDDIVVN